MKSVSHRLWWPWIGGISVVGAAFYLGRGVAIGEPFIVLVVGAAIVGALVYTKPKNWERWAIGTAILTAILAIVAAFRDRR